MYVITFYSFKGGVGRTLALANVAARLAQMGRRVLLVDFDLEAPGLETFGRLRPPQAHPGVVEYVKSYMDTKQSPDVRDYVYEAEPVGKKSGRLWVMPAGRRDANYQASLAKIDWKQLYHVFQGYWFFEDTKAQWDEAFQPDYVLIDSRTGHTDVEGICTRQLPDAVVVLFFPNEQNLVGLRDVCERIRAEKDRGLKKDIRLHFVMSNVPDLDDEDRVLRRRLQAFHEQLEFHKPDAIIHRYESVMLFNQAIFVLDKPRSRLAREYRRLVRTLIIENPADREGMLLLFRELQKESSRLINWKRWPTPDEINQVTHQFWDDTEVLLSVAQYLLRIGEPELALIRSDRVLQVQPSCPEALFLRGVCHSQLRNDKQAISDLSDYLQRYGPAAHFATKEAERNERAFRELLSLSIDAFAKAIDLPPIPLPGMRRTSHRASFFLTFPVEHLLRQRRWQEAIRYLETTVEVRIEGYTDPEEERAQEGPSFGLRIASAPAFQAFYLAMAYWGATGQLRRDLCSQTLDFLGPDDVMYLHDLGPIWFQELALLYWGVGDVERAARSLDNALEHLKGFGVRISYWTFQETTPPHFRHDCEQIRRMIQGEPIRPAFLGEPSALDRPPGVDRLHN